jgi:hypothetical protein
VAYMQAEERHQLCEGDGEEEGRQLIAGSIREWTQSFTLFHSKIFDDCMIYGVMSEGGVSSPFPLFC